VRRFLLDTNIAAALIDNRGTVLDRAREERRKGGRIGIGIPVLAELYYGVEFSSTRDENLRRLRRGVAGLIVWPFEQRAAAEFGRLRAELRRRGRPMQVIDIMIAAIALSLGNSTVVSTDSDLGAVPGLKVENWSE
jgi:tRNA(fMet)-specific endonuclease VapC